MCNDALVYDVLPRAKTLVPGKEYFICSCGRSKDGLICDGSHKGTDCKPSPVKAEDRKQLHFCMCKASGDFPYCDGTHSKFDKKDSVKMQRL